ncbi:hypothetical protein KR054_006903, partial [Drosophila jambulina]
NFVHLLEAAIAGCLRTYAFYKEDLARANVLLAAHFTRQAYKELGSRKTALQAKVTNILRLVDAMKRPEDRHMLVTMGYALMLTPGRAHEADAHFVTVLRHVPSHIPGLIGRGCLAYNRQDYIGALGFFKSVLMHQPRGPADVRVGIAHCFLKLGNLDSARRSFELALEHNGRCQNALLGIAILKLNQREKAPIREGINLLCAAHELNNRHPMVLNILASHYYYVRDYNNAPTLAGNSYMLTDIPLLQSQNCFQIARCFHATKQYDQATDFYTLAVRLAPEGYVLPQFGLAQMNLRRGEQGKAKTGLEILLKVMPNQIDALRLLAKIYLAEKRIDEAIKLLLKAVESRSSSSMQDYDSWLSLALAYEQKQRWKQAIEAYQRAMRIYGGRGEPYPIEWLNNVAVIQNLAQMPQQALESIDEALASAGAKGGDHKETNMLTLRFNRGRILEDLHRCDLAAIAYKDLVAEYPNYSDCYLRLGVMALRQNDVILAIDYFKDVLKHDNDSLAARTCLGSIYINMGLTTQAMYSLNVILNSSAKLDAYTLVAVGNVCLKNIQRCVATGDDASAKRHQQKALLFFAKVGIHTYNCVTTQSYFLLHPCQALERDPRNLWAANGIGASLSSRRRQSAGEAVFKQIVENGKVCPPSAILNLAHMALELGKHQDAIEAYMQCLEHGTLCQNSVEVMLGLAKALYLSGNSNTSKMWLINARHLAPHDPVVMFNLGLAIQEDTEQLLGRGRGKSLELIKAELELQVASGYFEHLAQCKGQTLVPQSEAAKQANICQSLLTKLPMELQRVRELEVLDEERIRLQEELQKEEEEQREQERLQREQAMAKRQAVLDRTKKLLKEPNELAPKKEKGQKGQKKDEEQDDGEEREGKKRKRSAAKASKSAKKKKTNEEAIKKPDKYKSKEFIDSDENQSE